MPRVKIDAWASDPENMVRSAIWIGLWGLSRLYASANGGSTNTLRIEKESDSYASGANNQSGQV